MFFFFIFSVYLPKCLIYLQHVVLYKSARGEIFDLVLIFILGELFSSVLSSQFSSQFSSFEIVSPILPRQKGQISKFSNRLQNGAMKFSFLCKKYTHFLKYTLVFVLFQFIRGVALERLQPKRVGGFLEKGELLRFVF